MNFKAKTAEDIKADKLMPEGVYPFEVRTAVDATSKKGNGMIALELTVYVNGRQRVQKDWLGTWNGGEEKLMSFCDSVGLGHKYSSGTLEASDCFGVQGYVRIGKQNNEQFGPQNTVKLYVREEDAEAINSRISGPAPVQSVRAAVVEDENVPF